MSHGRASGTTRAHVDATSFPCGATDLGRSIPAIRGTESPCALRYGLGDTVSGPMTWPRVLTDPTSPKRSAGISPVTRSAVSRCCSFVPAGLRISREPESKPGDESPGYCRSSLTGLVRPRSPCIIVAPRCPRLVPTESARRSSPLPNARPLAARRESARPTPGDRRSSRSSRSSRSVPRSGP